MDDDIIELIYESAFVPERWPEALARLANIVEAPRGSLFVLSAKPALWVAHGDPERTARVVNEGWLTRGTMLPRLLKLRHAGFFTEYDGFTPEELDEEPMYRDFFRPAGFGWGAGTLVPLPTGEMVFLALNRLFTRGPVERKFIDRLDPLRPHIARSVLMSARLQLERARAMGEALSLLGLPALVLDERGKALAANDLIEAMPDCVRWRVQDRVALTDPSADRLLRGAIESFHRADAQPTRSFPLRDREGAPIRVAHLIPVRRAARDIFTRCAAVLALTPVAAPNAPPVELVQALFDLTPAEARVARALASGKTAEDIATTGGVSLATIRTQLRGVLEKTGCGRQTDVVALLAGISAPGA